MKQSNKKTPMASAMYFKTLNGYEMERSDYGND